MWGFQLWVNLPREHKMMAPRYQDIPADRIPQVDVEGGRARVIAGTFAGVAGPVLDSVTRPLMLDVQVDGELSVPVPAEHAVFAYVFEGSVSFGASTPIERGHLVVLDDGDSVVARGDGRFLLLAGRPIGEPVARRGPFVMNTEEELRTAYADYQSGRLAG